jgi:hypothetical protein
MVFAQTTGRCTGRKRKRMCPMGSLRWMKRSRCMMAVGLVSLTLMPQKLNRSHTPWRELLLLVRSRRAHALAPFIASCLGLVPSPLALSVYCLSLSFLRTQAAREEEEGVVRAPYPEWDKAKKKRQLEEEERGVGHHTQSGAKQRRKDNGKRRKEVRDTIPRVGQSKRAQSQTQRKCDETCAGDGAQGDRKKKRKKRKGGGGGSKTGTHAPARARADAEVDKEGECNFWMKAGLEMTCHKRAFFCHYASGEAKRPFYLAQVFCLRERAGSQGLCAVCC